ncbi:hypothetical protein [Nitrososphaera sp. AFS]|uniref:hypothetical protein n=1 Tax=Nitrososphaera sp. AFS TaxID=2301191 RepID=UPI001917286A|nr:hypothetical protein [Nitrososphaera sp. AFS]
MYSKKSTAIVSSIAIVALAMLFATGPLVANNAFAHKYYNHHHHHTIITTTTTTTTIITTTTTTTITSTTITADRLRSSDKSRK